MRKFTGKVFAFAKHLRSELKDRSRDALAISLAIIITCAFTYDVQAQGDTVRAMDYMITVTAQDQANLDQPEAFTASLSGESYPNQVVQTDKEDSTIQVAALTTKATATAKPDPEPVPTTNTRLARVYPTTSRNVSSSSTRNSFPGGYCTSYVADNLEWDIDWRGNAGTWDEHAVAAGHKVGYDQAKAGNIVVTSESSVGHVAKIDAVKADGTLVISEMNVKGRGVTSSREISPNDPRIQNFIGE